MWTTPVFCFVYLVSMQSKPVAKHKIAHPSRGLMDSNLCGSRWYKEIYMYGKKIHAYTLKAIKGIHLIYTDCFSPNSFIFIWSRINPSDGNLGLNVLGRTSKQFIWLQLLPTHAMPWLKRAMYFCRHVHKSTEIMKHYLSKGISREWVERHTNMRWYWWGEREGK